MHYGAGTDGGLPEENMGETAGAACQPLPTLPGLFPQRARADEMALHTPASAAR